MALGVDRLRVHVIDSLQGRVADDIARKIGTACAKQCGKREGGPEDQRGQLQGGIRAEAARSRVKQRSSEVPEIEAGGAVNRVMGPTDQRMEIGDGLPRQVMVLREHQVGARRAIELAQAQYLLRGEAASPPLADPPDEQIEFPPRRFTLLEPFGNTHGS